MLLTAGHLLITQNALHQQGYYGMEPPMYTHRHKASFIFANCKQVEPWRHHPDSHSFVESRYDKSTLAMSDNSQNAVRAFFTIVQFRLRDRRKKGVYTCKSRESVTYTLGNKQTIVHCIHFYRIPLWQTTVANERSCAEAGKASNIEQLYGKHHDTFASAPE